MSSLTLLLKEKVAVEDFLPSMWSFAGSGGYDKSVSQHFLLISMLTFSLSFGVRRLPSDFKIFLEGNLFMCLSLFSAGQGGVCSFQFSC